MKIALVGPVHPYRGGIAQYTTQLKRALEPICELLLLSFKRQYPAWLYPGKSDTEPGAEGGNEPGVRYTLDLLSPFSWWRTANEISASGCQVAVISWWTLVWALPFAFIAWRLRRRGVASIFLCHNLCDHGAGGIKARVTRHLLSQAHGYIVHAKAMRKEIEKNWPDRPVLQRSLPIFRHFPEPRGDLPKRGRLEVLYFGFIRPYKGLEVLLEAASALNDPDLYLTIVGEPWGDSQRFVSQQERLPNVEIHPHYVDDAAAAEFFGRADVVALPYLNATGSGVIALAYHYGKPVIATSVSGLVDAVIDGRTGWLVPPASVVSLARVLRELNRYDAEARRADIEAFVSGNDWDSMAGAILEFSKQQLPSLRRGDHPGAD